MTNCLLKANFCNDKEKNFVKFKDFSDIFLYDLVINIIDIAAIDLMKLSIK